MDPTTFDLFRSLGGYYQSLLLHHFFRSGLFDLLAEPRTVELLAQRLGWRPGELNCCLEFLRTTTRLIDRDRERLFRLSISKTELQGVRFEVTKFVGAYGPTAVHLDRTLSNAGSGLSLVDRRALAEAFRGVKDVSRGWIVPMLLGAQVSSLIDLGCGTASLLVELAGLRAGFRGVGVDGSREMCKVARLHARSHGVSRRVRIVCADVRDVGSLPEGEALYAASLLNELFANGADEAVDFLRRLKERYPGRDCWFVDYYGQLDQGPKKTGREVTHALLHDLIQVLSGQGVPPPDLKAWRVIYRHADVKLVEAHEFQGRGITWFVHRVRM